MGLLDSSPLFFLIVGVLLVLYLWITWWPALVENPRVCLRRSFECITNTITVEHRPELRSIEPSQPMGANGGRGMTSGSKVRGGPRGPKGTQRRML